MSIGERITELRKAASLSQGQLAQRMGVTRQAVSKWENDLSTPDPLRLIQLADALGTDSEYLASGQHATLPSPPVVVHSVEEKPVYVEKVVEKPVYVEKVVEKPVEKTVVQYVEKPVIKKVFRTKYRRNPAELAIVGIACFLLGLLVGYFL